MDEYAQQYHEMLQQMYGYYRSQPSCMLRLLSERDSIVAGFVSFYNRHRPDRIYLVGSGTSLNALRAASDFMESVLGVEIICAPPTNMPFIRGARPFVIAASQSGKSSNTVSLLKGLRGTVPTVSFISGSDNPLAHISDLTVDISVGDETVGPKTVGYTGTVLCLYLAALGAALAGETITPARYQTEIARLEETARAGEANLKACEDFYHTHLADLKTARHFLFVGKGPAAAVAAEDALKVLETLCLPSAGYEFEEYLHGPCICTNEQTALFLFNSADQDSARMEKMAHIVGQASRNSYIIDRTGTLHGPNILSLKSADSPYASPFVDIFFGQLLSAQLTQALGIVRHPAARTITADMDTKTKDAAK